MSDGQMSIIKEPDATGAQKLKWFVLTHWAGLLTLITPIIISPLLFPLPGLQWKWCAYVLIIMGIFWVTDCIPLPITAFLPIVVFPMVNIMHTDQTCECYMNDSVMMFLSSIMLAFSVEQSGLHKRLAYFAISLIGYSHVKLLLAICCVTTFVSMWVTNTAATTMMIPICNAILKVLENEGILNFYDKRADGELVSSDITACYFCAITFSATVGGIGTLVGTATNLVFKGLFMSKYPLAPEYLSFPKFSAFSVPYMIVLEAFTYLYLAVYYLGLFSESLSYQLKRAKVGFLEVHYEKPKSLPKSKSARAARISEQAKAAAKATIVSDWNKLGSLTYWESMVIILFGGAILAFFCRSPQLFDGWGDMIADYFAIPRAPAFVRDSGIAMFVSFLMFLLPSSMILFKNLTIKYKEDLPKSRVVSVLDWIQMNASLPYSFMFLLGGGIALARAADRSGLNRNIGVALQVCKHLPNLVNLFLIILVVIFITNFASNVAVCNVFGPIAMSMANEINQNPLWYILAAGFSASYCFMIPVGTPGNLIAQSAAKMPAKKMAMAGLGPTITTLLFSWVFISFYAPVIWPDLHTLPFWLGIRKTLVVTTTSTTTETTPTT